MRNYLTKVKIPSLIYNNSFMLNTETFYPMIPSITENTWNSLKFLSISIACDSEGLAIKPENVIMTIKRFVDEVVYRVEIGDIAKFIVPLNGGLLLYFLIKKELDSKLPDNNIPFMFANKRGKLFSEDYAGGKLSKREMYTVNCGDNYIVNPGNTVIIDDIYESGGSAESIYYSMNANISTRFDNKMRVLSPSTKDLNHRTFKPTKTEFTRLDALITFEDEWILGSFGMNGSTRVPESFDISNEDLLYMEFLERTCSVPLKKSNPAIPLFSENDDSEKFYKYVQILEEFNMFGRCRGDIVQSEFYNLYLEYYYPES